MSHRIAHDPWPDQTTVPVIEVARAAGLPRYDIRKVELQGLIDHAGRRGPGAGRGKGGALMLTHDDALYLLNAALLAAAAGMALVTVVRMLQQTGARLGPSGFMIPLPTAP